MAIKEVKTDYFKNIELAINVMSKKVAKVGWFEKSKYNDKKQTPVAQVAIAQEFGVPSKNIPARPFMRPTITSKENEWKEIALQKSKAVIQGKISSDDLLELIAQKAESDVLKTIKSIWSPALAEKTILARIHRSSKLNKIKGRINNSQALGGITKPLIDTGLMIGTLTHSVEEE